MKKHRFGCKFALADASSTKILLKRDCVNSLADLSECCSQ